MYIILYNNSLIDAQKVIQYCVCEGSTMKIVMHSKHQLLVLILTTLYYAHVHQCSLVKNNIKGCNTVITICWFK